MRHRPHFGWEFLRDAHHIKREIEAEYIALLGEARWEALGETLRLIVVHD